MKNTKNLLIAAAVTGALAAYPLSSRAEVLSPVSGPGADKLGCAGKAGCGGKDKAGCGGKEQQGKKGEKGKGGDKDKSACAGKDGCGGKDKQK